jgi:hypothetical protein
MTNILYWWPGNNINKIFGFKPNFPKVLLLFNLTALYRKKLNHIDANMQPQLNPEIAVSTCG